jgi:WD repeat-containing protein 70
LQFWYNRSTNWKPDLYIPNAHGSNNEITSIVFFDDSFRFVTRGEDNTMKLWDLRRIKKPIYVWENLPCFSSKTCITLSPDNSIIMTGTCVKKGHENSKLAFFSAFNYEKIKEFEVSQYSIVGNCWNEKINQ